MKGWSNYTISNSFLCRAVRRELRGTRGGYLSDCLLGIWMLWWALTLQSRPLANGRSESSFSLHLVVGPADGELQFSSNTWDTYCTQEKLSGVYLQIEVHRLRFKSMLVSSDVLNYCHNSRRFYSWIFARQSRYELICLQPCRIQTGILVNTVSEKLFFHQLTDSHCWMRRFR